MSFAQKYQHLFEVNEARGSFYLQSKVYRAQERIKKDYEEKGLPWDEPEQPAPTPEEKQHIP